MNLVENDFNTDCEKTFAWFNKHGVQVASITLYADGLVEFNSETGSDIAIESIGRRDESVRIGQIEIRVGSVQVGG